MYRLDFTRNINLLSNLKQGNVQDFFFVYSENKYLVAFIRCGPDLIGFKYISTTATWQQHWNEPVFNERDNLPLGTRPWLITDKLLPNVNILVLKHQSGIRFYELDNNTLGYKLLIEDNNFHDMNSYTLLGGSFFPDEDWIGCMTRSSQEAIKFYAATNDSFHPDVDYPLFPLEKNLSLNGSWNSASNEDIFVTRLSHKNPAVIGLRTTRGLEFYRFNADYLLESFVNTSQIIKPPLNTTDYVFFANLTHQMYQDILHLNDSGLYTYQYNSDKNDYAFLHQHIEFTQSYGWLSCYRNSIQLVDFNNDGQDDLVFTGVHGLTALTFDSVTNDWKMLLDPNDLPRLKRYVNLVGILPPTLPIIPYQSIFTQDTDGKIQWAKIVQDLPITTSTPSPINVAPTGVIETRSNQIEFSKNISVTEEKFVSDDFEKPILLWTEQWDISFLKNAVDTTSGQVRLNIPLVDVSSLTGWELKFTLSYDSQSTTSNLLGEGWSLPLVQDYIIIDYRGSTAPEDTFYYLMTQGDPLPLKMIENGKNIQRFEFHEASKDKQMTIEYQITDQRWIIDGTTEQVVYGKANNSNAQDALRWSLVWPNWLGPGRDGSQLQPLIVAWYLNMRYDKFSKTSLYYNYEMDSSYVINGKAYTSELRLANINDGLQMQILLDYRKKTSSEYTLPDPIDDDGNIVFPVALSGSHYLQEYSVSTSAYSQQLQFDYIIDDEKRLLKSITQQLLSRSNTIFQFTYNTLLGHQVITSCALPSLGSVFNFFYEIITPPAPTNMHDNLMSYPTTEKTKTVYGPDYTVMGYQYLSPVANRINLRIMNREMTKIIKSFVVNPSTEVEINNYFLKTYKNSFILFTESDQKKVIYIYNRHEELNWFTNSTISSYSNKALIRFSEEIIAITEPNQTSILLWEHNDNQSNWYSNIVSIPRAVTFLTLNKRLVVGYDDFELSLLYQDLQSNWRRKLLESSVIGLKSLNNKTLKCLNLTSKLSNQISTILDQNGVQMFNNFVLLNGLQENDGQLSTRVYLYLLDSQFAVAKKQSFMIKRENIYHIEREFKSQDEKIIYHCGYVKEGNIFKIRTKGISGEHIKNIRNKNLREDAIQKFKESNDKMLDSTQDKIWLNWNLYQIQIGQFGAYCGNDTLLRITGNEWEQVAIPIKQNVIHLGKHFVLEQDNDNELLFKLYKQNNVKRKIGEPIKEFLLHSPGQIINRYPTYIAYQQTENSVRVHSFENEQILSREYVFHNEKLLFESSFQNLLTLYKNSTTMTTHAESQDFRVRSTIGFVPTKSHLYVSKFILNDKNVNTQRITGFQRHFENNQQESIYSETIALIPGDNKTTYGWYETTRLCNINNGNITNSHRWFNADGQQVSTPFKDKVSEPNLNATSSEFNKQLLLDNKGKWVISDLSPYSIEDEMICYYGFESYENNVIKMSSVNSKVTKTWRINQGKITDGGFAFTGKNYLKLENPTIDKSSFLEGVLEPRDQEITYLAACWIRCNSPLVLNKPVPYLKAALSTYDGQEFIELLAQTKNKIENWVYLELKIDFQVIKQIYQNYLNYIEEDNYEIPRFIITLRVETPFNQTIDVDHIRFWPITHDFEANIYHPLNGKSIATIQANGLVTRTVYDRQQQEIASIDEEGQLKHFYSSSKTGKLASMPQGTKINAKPNIISFEPESGFYETFDSYAWSNRWEIDNPDAWSTIPGKLFHKQLEKHRIKSINNLFYGSSVAFRCYFTLQKPQSSIILEWERIGRLELIRQTDNLTKLILPSGCSISLLPSTGELIIMLEKNWIWLWLDGVLLVDQILSLSSMRIDSLTPWPSFVLEAQGKILIEDCLIMSHPQLRVEYHNAFGEKTQVIQLEDTRTILVSEILYDELGRDALSTKTTRIVHNQNQSLLAYRPDFVKNRNPSDSFSVWHTSTLQGEVDRFNPADQGFAYTQTKYASNPLNEPEILGLPGPDFAVTGRYSTKMSQDLEIAFLYNYFPVNQGYRQKVEYMPNGSNYVSVFDKNNNKVARYVRVQGYNNLLSTYEYDPENRLIKILPPLYHEKVYSFTKLTSWRPGEYHLSNQEKEWQKALATFYFYNKYGHLIRKITPESGTTEYLYNKNGLNRFMVSLDLANRSKSIVYFDYNSNGLLTNTGYINQSLSINVLQQYVESTFRLPNSQSYQSIDYSDNHPDPLIRGRLQEYITDNEGDIVIEKLQFNAQKQVTAKGTISQLDDQDNGAQLNEIKKHYLNDKLHILTIPITVDGQPLSLIHSYNKIGQLVALGTKDQIDRYAIFNYHATGQVASEQYQPSSLNSFIRYYNYTSPGYLEKISDSFLTETISYLDNGYGQPGHGNGMIMQTAFNVSWPVNSDGRWFKIQENDFNNEYAKMCIEALKRTGHITGFKTPMKLFTNDAESEMPLLCGGKTGQNLAKLVAEKQRPNYYGHRYSYGNHQELVKAKYFNDKNESLIEPLQPKLFATKISTLTNSQSEQIWKILVNSGFIINDQPGTDFSNAIGRRGKSFLRTTDLYKDLVALNSDYTLYVEPITRLISVSIVKNKTISLIEFENSFMYWQSTERTFEKHIKKQKLEANEIGQMLFNKSYLPVQSTDFTEILDTKFKNILQEYSKFVPDIVRILLKHFEYALGETPFDVASYNIDANGNHHLFYTGFNRYEMYYGDTNQMKTIKFNSPTLQEPEQISEVHYDNRGNVIRALHQNIEHIDYHPVSERTTNIRLRNGKTIRFYYDAQGERTLKRTVDVGGKVSDDVFYLRDERGNLIMDKRIKYSSEPTQKVVTAYLYGPRGFILGFIRNNKFYSVTTDHAGSVRLVIDAGRVVAAYDYLPYGQLMRSYGNDPQAHIYYRYTGQEWDEETGLYNYHARFYDPSIGRFYQPDPKSQYFSPYQYAGNSPISTIDPDGEFAFVLIAISVGCGLLGAYLGGAAANNRWNPKDWDMEDRSTYFGIFGGALSGTLLPVGFGASVSAIGLGATLTLGLGGTYLGASAANIDWNPGNWEWKKPGTWNAAFDGFGMGSGIAGGIGVVHKFANTGKAITALRTSAGISERVAKNIFLGISYTTGVSIAYGSGLKANEGQFKFWQWDWTNPSTWYALANGFDTGTGWPQNVMEVGYGISRLSKNSQKSYNILGKNPRKDQFVKAILKNPKHPLYKTTASLVMAYYMGSSANEDFDITLWSWNSFSTYEGILNGVFFGKDTLNMIKFARSSKTKEMSNQLTNTNKHDKTHWDQTFSSMLKDLQMSYYKKMYEQTIKQFFSSDAILRSKSLQLKHKSVNIIKDIENFFEGGIQKWKNRETKPPKELHKFILENVRESDALKKYNEWKIESDESLKKRYEIFVDQEVDFLNCHSVRRRKKRATGCHVDFKFNTEVSSEYKQNRHKPELVEQLFDDIDIVKSYDQSFSDLNIPDATNEFTLIRPKNKKMDDSSTNGDNDSNIKLESVPEKYLGIYTASGFDSSSPKGFEEHLSVILRKTPNNLGPSYNTFFPAFILGSILTLPISNLNHFENKRINAKIETVLVPEHRTTRKESIEKNELYHKILKVFYTVEKDGLTQLVFKTFISEKKSLVWYENANRRIQHEYFLGKLSESSELGKHEVLKIFSDLGLQNNCKIHQSVYYITVDNELLVKKLYPETIFDNSFRMDGETITNFMPIEFKNKNDVSVNFNHLSSSVAADVQFGIEGIAHQITEMYNSQLTKFLPDTNLEATFHGFFYGVLSLNFKYRYHLDIYVERIAGKGYADLFLLSRKNLDGNINISAVPIVVELKADKTSVLGGIEQIINKGYLYNLNMRTLSTDAVLVSINPNAKPGDRVLAKINKMPQSEGLVNQFAKDFNNNNDRKVGLINELQFIYSTISNLAIKTPKNKLDNYFGLFILGNIISAKSVQHLFFRKNKNVNTFFFFCVNESSMDEDGRWIMLNVADSSSYLKKQKTYVYNDKDVEMFYRLPKLKINHPHKDTFLKVDISLNSRSKSGWSITDDTPEEYKKEYCFQSLIQEFEDTSNFKPSNEYTNIEVPDLTETTIFGSLESKKKIINDLSKLTESVKSSINSESDFQGFLHGFFSNQYDNLKSTKVLSESNFSKEGRLDLILYEQFFNVDHLKYANIIIMELKYATNLENLKSKIKEANSQVTKYSSNIKSITDSDEFTPIALVFYKKAANKAKHIEYKIYSPQIISHSTSGRITPDSDQMNKKKRSVDYTKHYENIAEHRREKVSGSREDTVTSGANGGLQFWPIAYVKKVGRFVLSSLLSGSLFRRAEENDQGRSIRSLDLNHPPTSDLSTIGLKRYFVSDETRTGPTLLEMGDRWLKETDVNGLLAWGILLTIKRTGYNHTYREDLSIDNGLGVELDIRSAGLVEEFQNLVLEHAQINGIRSCVSDIVECSELYCDAVKTVRSKLAEGELLVIPRFLCKILIEDNFEKIASRSAREKAIDLKSKLTDSIPNLQRKYLVSERKWLQNKQSFYN